MYQKEKIMKELNDTSLYVCDLMISTGSLSEKKRFLQVLSDLVSVKKSLSEIVFENENEFLVLIITLVHDYCLLIKKKACRYPINYSNSFSYLINEAVKYYRNRSE